MNMLMLTMVKTNLNYVTPSNSSLFYRFLDLIAAIFLVAGGCVRRLNVDDLTSLPHAVIGTASIRKLLLRYDAIYF
jgi:hypothetical protein